MAKLLTQCSLPTFLTCPIGGSLPPSPRSVSHTWSPGPLPSRPRRQWQTAPHCTPLPAGGRGWFLGLFSPPAPSPRCKLRLDTTATPLVSQAKPLPINRSAFHRSPGRGQTPPSNMTGLSLPACSACGHLSYGSPTAQWHRPEGLGFSLAPHSSFHPYIKSTPGCLQVPPSSPPPSPAASLPGCSFHPTWPSSKPSGSHPTLTGISLSPTHQLKPPCYLHLVLHAVGSHPQVVLGLQASAPWT